MVRIDNNTVKASELQLDADKFLPDVAGVRNIRIAYGKNAEGKKDEDVIEAVRYDCVNMANLSTFTIKVEGKKPILRQEDVVNTEQPLFIEIPLKDVVIKVYEVNFGVAKISIVAPYVTLVEV